MNMFQYYKSLILSKLNRRGNEFVVEKMRKEGMVVGDNTHIYSNIAASEPYLVTIGCNCTISSDVVFITHDASVGLYGGGRNVNSDICGKIQVGDNCFIGSRVIIIYGVSIPNNTIVAAGSVVTKSFVEPGCIIGGNPAKIIGRVNEFMSKNKNYLLRLHGLSVEDRKHTILNSGKLIRK